MSEVKPNEVPVKEVTTSQFTINLRDLGRGSIIAVISAVIVSLYSTLQTGSFADIKWEQVLSGAVSAWLAYLIKNFVDPTRTVTVFKKQS